MQTKMVLESLAISRKMYISHFAILLEEMPKFISLCLKGDIIDLFPRVSLDEGIINA